MSHEQPFGRRVRERRRALDLTQEELARRVGCAAVTIRKIEAGDMRPSQQVAGRLAASLGVPPDERSAFVRLARSVVPEGRAPSPQTPPLAAEEIGAADLSGRAIRGYQLGERIGAGGFGVVYRAVQPFVEREVAVKIILPQYADHPEFVRRFEAEAQLVARLEHPRIVPLYDYWREPGVAYLVMRYLRGGSLHALLQQGPLLLSDAMRIMEQLGEALHASHRAGVVHRDLKPANILLDDDRNAYVADFGIAKDLGRALEESAFGGAFVGSPAYSAPEQIRAEPVSAQTDIYALGMLLYELLTGRRPFDGPTPVAYIQQHLSAAVPPLAARRAGLPVAADRVIQRATAKVPSVRYPDVRELVAELRAALGERAHELGPLGAAPITAAPPTVVLDLSEADNPFKGLRPFGEADAVDFFGREALVQQLLARMGEAGELARFLAVIGPSGSGKSSALRAGLVPALRAGALQGSEQWYVVDLLPGARPLRELATALRRVAPAGVEADDLLALLRADQRGLLRAARVALPSDEGELVIVIDQFEELFTLAQDEAERAQLLDSIVTAVLDERSRLRVVVTLRADFIDRPLQYVDFGELLKQRAELVLPLTPEELERAISGPARRAGLALEEGLAASIIADAGGQPGMLPLLQHALSELFARREGRALTRRAYHEIGGVTGALARSAEASYERLGAEARAAARQVLLRLVTPGEGAEDTRRRALRSELNAAGVPAAVEQVIDRFGQARLLTFDRDPATREPTLEVAHEALLREWPRLRGWVDAARDDLRVQRRLAQAAAEWAAAGRDPGFLAAGARLGQFAALGEGGVIQLGADERAYLDASIAAREVQERAERERAERELRQAQALAEEQRARADEQARTGRRLRYLTGALAAFLAIALILSAFAFSQRQQAQDSAAEAAASFTRAEAQRLAAEANVVAQSGGSAELVALLALRSLQQEYTPQGDAALVAGSVQELPLRALSGHEQWLEDIAFTPDGQSLVTASRDGTVRLWDRASGQELRRFVGHDGPVYAVAVAPGGATLATGGYDRTVRLWDMQTGRELWRAGGGDSVTEQAVYALAFAPDGATLVGGGADHRIKQWDAASGEQLRTVASGVGTIYGLAFSPDGQLLASAHGDNFVRLWGIEDRRANRALQGHSDQVRDVAFSPDGTRLLSGSFDRTARLWDVTSGQELARLAGHREFVWDVAFTPDGQHAITASQDKSARLWDLERGVEIRRYTGHQSYVIAAALSPDGAQLATASRDSTAMLWQVEPDAGSVQLLGHRDDVHMAVYSPDGRYVLTGSLDRTARLWEVASGRELQEFRGHGAAIHAVAFAPDGRHVVTAGFDGFVFVWDIATGETVQRLGQHQGTVYGLAYSPDGRFLVSSGDDSDPKVLVWDTESWAPVMELRGHSGAVHSLVISPDSRQLLSGSFDRTVRLWDLESGTELRRYDMMEGVEALDFAPDGQAFVSGGFDKTARVWDLESGRELQSFIGHSDTVKSATFSRDGAYVITASADNTARLWDRASGQELRRFSGHAGILNSVDVSPDGRFLCTASGDSSVRVWSIDYQGTVDAVCSRLRRDFTAEERAQFGIPDGAATCGAVR